MDKKQEFFLTYTSGTLPPAQLFVGQYAQALEAVELCLQKMLCKHNGCNTCITCMQIRERQHHAIMWLHPEKNYTLEQLNCIFETLAFQLQPDELFFFIIEKADFLSAACANKLLKPMEEPPMGYHFILLAQHSEQIVPTIKSRCLLHTLESSTTPHTTHPLVEVFTTKIVASNDFAKIIDSITINERESIELLDHIIGYWLSTYKKNHATNMVPLITLLHKAQLQPPMPGSSTLFWRNLYLQTHDTLIEAIK
jgi:DNA polymerase-3 subunit delta'